MMNKVIDFLSSVTMENEMWAPIDINGEYTNYFISNNGRMISIKTRKILKQSLNFKGYPFIGICQNGKYKTLLSTDGSILAPMFCAKLKPSPVFEVGESESAINP